jgi:uncharacterized coiled-coil protein SlyX
MSTMESEGGTLAYRVAALERELEMQRQRIHELVAEQNAMRLTMQSNTDSIRYLTLSVNALRRAVVQVGVAFVTSSVILAISLVTVFGKP